MVYVEHISEEEQKILIDYFKKGPNTLVRARAQAVMLSESRMTADQIATIVIYHANTVRDWITSWNTDRVSSLYPAYEDNENASKLTKEQKAEIKDVLHTPDSLPTEFWSLPKLKHHVATTFGVRYESDQSYYYLLKHCGYSFKLPTPFDRRRDDEQVIKRMKEIKAEIQPYLTDPDWEVYVADETRLDWEEQTMRAWLPRGAKTVIKLERTKQGQSFFGALSLKTKKHWVTPLDWQNTDTIITALQKLKRKHRNKRICLIWDNAPWYKAKALREELKTNHSLASFHLIHFPPYAPDENPQEHVWKYGKEQVANQHFTSFTDLTDTFIKTLQGETFAYSF